jgi:hypothetical protein
MTFVYRAYDEITVVEKRNTDERHIDMTEMGWRV